MKEFNRESLEFYMKDSFKGLSKEYMLDKIFDEEIQKNWVPSMGDIIVGCTGNIFVIGHVDYLSERIGGTKYYFGGGSCNRDGGIVLDSTFYFTANKDGLIYDLINPPRQDVYHSKISDFRFVPYPHELKNEN